LSNCHKTLKSIWFTVSSGSCRISCRSSDSGSAGTHHPPSTHECCRGSLLPTHTSILKSFLGLSMDCFSSLPRSPNFALNNCNLKVAENID
jgi:hypothetical protein